MANFRKVKLGDIFKLEYGKGLVAEKRISGDYPVYGSSGCVGMHNEFLIDGPGIIVGRKGSAGEVYFSKNNFYPIDTAYYISKNDEKYNIRFLYYFLKNLNLKRLQGDTGVPGLNRNTAYGEVVEFPFNIPTQTRIASVLSAYDDLIENNEKRIKALEEMAQLLYTEWFVKFKFPGHEKVKLVDSGTGYDKIPEGWQVKKLGKVVHLNPITKISKKENILNVPMEALSNKLNIVNINKAVRKNTASGSKFINGDTLFARITPCMQNGKNGFVNFLSPSEVACGSTEFVILRPNVLTPIYIYFLTRSSNFREAAKLTMVGASGRQRVQSVFFQRYLVVVPDNEVMNKFELMVENYFMQMRLLYNQNQSLSKTRDLLIPQLVTGRRELK